MKIKDVDLTLEQEEALRRFLPIRSGGTFIYVPHAWRESGLPKACWPVFELLHLSGAEIVESEDMLRGTVSVSGGEGSVQVKRGEYAVAMCRRGIKRWKNYSDVDGKDIKYSDKDSIDVLPPDLLYELCNAITERKELTADELLGLE